MSLIFIHIITVHMKKIACSMNVKVSKCSFNTNISYFILFHCRIYKLIRFQRMVHCTCKRCHFLMFMYHQFKYHKLIFSFVNEIIIIVSLFRHIEFNFFFVFVDFDALIAISTFHLILFRNVFAVDFLFLYFMSFSKSY